MAENLIEEAVQEEVSGGKNNKKAAKNKKADKPVSAAKQAKIEKKNQKKEIKALRKEAKVHSLKFENRKIFRTRVLCIFMIISMLAVTGVMIFTTLKVADETKTQTTESSGVVEDSADVMSDGVPADAQQTADATPAGQSAETTPADTNAQDSAPAKTDAETPASNSNQTADLSTKAGIVAYYKTAHDNTVAQAKSVKQVYSNTKNYNNVLEIDNNSTLSGIAQSLMSKFLKEDTTVTSYSGNDIKEKFPGKNNANLTADMIAEATCKDNGSTYEITLKTNSTEAKYDLGEKASCLLTTVVESDITGAAGSLAQFKGIENRYIGSTIKATVDKNTNRITHIETDSPSYMFFAEVKAAVVIKVSNCRIGLEYFTKWDAEY